MYRDIENEIVKAVEGGYLSAPVLSANVNGYFTQCKNKPSNGGVTMLDDEPIRANINGMDLHKGIEMDMVLKYLIKRLLNYYIQLGIEFNLKTVFVFTMIITTLLLTI